MLFLKIAYYSTVLLFLGSYFRALLTEPGRVPIHNFDDQNNESERESELWGINNSPAAIVVQPRQILSQAAYACVPSHY